MLETWACFFDVHWPDDAPGYWGAARALLRALKPDGVLLGGDMGEFAAGSSHVSEDVRPSFEASLEPVRQELKGLRRLLPAARIVYLEGNHETALDRYLARGAPAARSSFHLAEELGCDALDIEWVPEHKQPWVHGRMKVLHGHQMPGRNLPKHHAAAVSDRYGEPGYAVLFGHSHRPGMYVRPLHGSMTSNCRVYAMGCGRTLDPAWMKGGVGGWENEMAVVHLRHNGTPVVQVLPYVDGCFVYAGKEYRAAAEDSKKRRAA